MKAGTRLGLDIASVAAAIRRGEKMTDIARQFRIGLSRVYRIRAAHGIPLRRPRLTQPVINDIVERLKRGELHKDIAAAVGSTDKAVGRIAIKVGIRRAVSTGRLPQHSIEMAFRTGQKCKAIAKALGCSPTTIHKLLKMRGIDISGWGRKVTDQQVRACFLAGMTGAEAARKLGVKDGGPWYRRWRRIAAGIPKQQGPKKP
jgi:transposase-like protein